MNCMVIIILYAISAFNLGGIIALYHTINKQKENMAKIELTGWIARDEELHTSSSEGTDLFLYPYEPIRTVGNFVDERGYCMSLPKELFPEQKWEDEPRKVKITIETID